MTTTLDIARMVTIGQKGSVDLSGAPILAVAAQGNAPSTATVRPFGVYMRVDDVIEVYAISTEWLGDIVTVTGRMVDLAGTTHDFQFTVPIEGTDSAVVDEYAPGEGFLQSLGFSCQNTDDSEGDFLFVSAGLRSAKTNPLQWYATLFSNRISEDYTLGWPGTICLAPIEVSPVNLFTSGTTEPNGEIFFTTGPNQVWEVSAVYLKLVATGGGAARTCTLAIAPTGSNYAYQCTSTVTCAGGASQEYIFMPGIQPFTDGSGRSFSPLPNPCLAWPTGTHATVRTITGNLTSGDAYTINNISGRTRIDIG